MNTTDVYRQQEELARFFSLKNRQRVAEGKRPFYVFPSALQFSCGVVREPVLTQEEITHQVMRRRSSAPKAPQKGIVLTITRGASA